MQPRCKKCGRPLNSPESIARGMGPECAGISSSRRRSVSVRRCNGLGSTYDIHGKNQTALPMFSWTDDDAMRVRVPDPLTRFPPDLLCLVLSAPARGAIAMRVKSHRRKRSKAKEQSPIVTIKEIRRKCIDLRMRFWPGFSAKGEPLACIPSGDNDWRIGQDGREISENELVSYLQRYGVI